MKRRLLTLLGLVLGLLTVAAPAGAHPLGNFTVNQHLGLHLSPGGLEVDYVVDMAEIPTVQARRQLDGDRDGRRSPAEEAAHRDAECDRLVTGIRITIDGEIAALTGAGALLSFPPGQGGLETLRLECRYSATLSAGSGTIEVTLDNFADRLGWREIVASGRGVDVGGALATTSVTGRLTVYPDDRLSSPADVRRGTLTYEVLPGSGDDAQAAPPSLPAAGPSLPAAARANPLAALITEADLGPGPVLIALLAAFVIGIGHALAPGHGKTITAAYLVGDKGTPRQAVILALAVALAHTAGVIVLGLVTLAASAAFRPERLYAYLSTASGVIILGIGAGMLVRWYRRRRQVHTHDAHTHDHGHAHDHGHHHHGRGHVHGDPAEGGISWKLLATLGLAGGLVPSASAVILMLGAIHLGRVEIGLALIVAFGLGMAFALVGVGMGLVVATRLGLRLVPGRLLAARVQAVLPAVMGVVVLAVGTVLTALSLGDVVG